MIRAASIIMLGSWVVAAASHPVDFSKAVELGSPSVVNIQASSERAIDAMPDDSIHRNLPDFLDRLLPGDDDDEMPRPAVVATGSGFIISADGLIVTNHHVVDGAAEISVRLSDRRTLAASLVGSDPATDIALLRVDAKDLPIATIGDSAELSVGDWVVAIGSPFNFENSVTAGIVSAKRRSFARQQYVPFVQSDVPINRGNSGGPLLDLGGAVVAVNSQIFSESGTYVGLSFSIPIEIAMHVVEQLRSSGEVARGLLGVGIEDVTRELADALELGEARGAIVTFVTAGSAAQRAGLQPWDVVTELNGEPIETYSDLPPRVGMIQPGERARLAVIRDGRLQEIEVVVGQLDQSFGPRPDRPEEEAPAPMGPRLGLELIAVDDGLEIVAVNSPKSWRAGVRPGDVVLSINQAAVNTVEGFDAHLSSAAGGKNAMLIRRGRGRTFVVVE